MFANAILAGHIKLILIDYTFNVELSKCCFIARCILYTPKFRREDKNGDAKEMRLLHSCAFLFEIHTKGPAIKSVKLLRLRFRFLHLQRIA